MDNHRKNTRPLWGILGGMGPLASAEFLASIYKLSLGRVEQDMPRLLLVSDPTVPDRTEAILNGEYCYVVRSLELLLKTLWSVHVDYIVIPCVTAHFFLPYLNLPHKLTCRLVSLLDVVFESLLADRRRYILLCTSGTRKARIFQSDPRWKEARRHGLVILPSDADQKTIHKYLYDMKTSGCSGDMKLLKGFATKYKADGFIAGCTEIHLQVSQLISWGLQIIDPLSVLAQQIAESGVNHARSGMLSSQMADRHKGKLAVEMTRPAFYSGSKAL